MLRAVLRRETEGVTALILIQRIGTIMDADHIVVVKDDAVAGIGRHEDLLCSCPEYLEIARSQLSEEELGI